MDYYEVGLDWAERLIAKLGKHDTSPAAPLNFMCSRPYFRTLDNLPNGRAKSDFARGYRDGWDFGTMKAET